MQNLIEITDLNITLDKKKLFEHFSLQVRQGDTLGICAPTGKGKTTLLNYIAQKYYQKIKISYLNRIIFLIFFSIRQNQLNLLMI